MKVVKRFHLFWIVPLCLLFGSTATAVVFLLARAFMDATVQFYVNDSLIQTLRQLTWHDVGLLLRAQGLWACFVFGLTIAVANQLIIAIGNAAKRALRKDTRHGGTP